MKKRLPTQFPSNPQVYLLGYKTEYSSYVDRILSHPRHTHLAVQVGDWCYHITTDATPDNSKAYWVSEEVSNRLWKKPLTKILVGTTDKKWEDIVNFSLNWSSPLYLTLITYFTFRLFRWKKDCVTYSRKYLEYLVGIKIKHPHSVTPDGFIKEILNCGYKNSMV